VTQTALINVALVAAGGGLGAAARFGLSLALQRVSLTMPYGTLAANCAGCFIMGVLAALVARELPLTPATRLFLATGFCGGLTTFSTFIYELHQFVSAREVFFSALYVLASFGGSAAAFVLGLLLIELCVRH